MSLVVVGPVRPGVAVTNTGVIFVRYTKCFKDCRAIRTHARTHARTDTYAHKYNFIVHIFSESNVAVIELRSLLELPVTCEHFRCRRSSGYKKLYEG